MYDSCLQDLLDEVIGNMQKNLDAVKNPEKEANLRNVAQPRIKPDVDPIYIKKMVQMFNEEQRFSEQCEMYASNNLNDDCDFICLECKKYFKYNLKYKIDKCTLCVNEETSLPHFLMHKIDLLHCEICETSVSSLKLLYEHLRSKHSFIFYNCFCCDEVFQLKYSILYHMIFEHKLNKHETIWKNMEYKCVQCKETYSKLSAQKHINSPKKHFEITHLQDKINCIICKKSISQDSQDR